MWRQLTNHITWIIENIALQGYNTFYSIDSNIDVDIQGDLLEAKNLFYQNSEEESIGMSWWAIISFSSRLNK